MRSAFIKTLLELAHRDERIFLLTADLGYSVVEPFVETFPERFINTGVAEQNMIGVATGLAKAGYIPFVYSISNFAALRPYEFIRNGPVIHKLPVRIVGVGAGFDYAHAGRTHYGLEDVGVFRLQEGMTVIVPVDNQHTQKALLKTWDFSGPIYYRLGKTCNKTSFMDVEQDFCLTGVNRLEYGKDLVFVSMGSITKEVLQAIALLKGKGIASSLVVVSSFGTGENKDLLEILRDFKIVITVEEHSVTGGLGSYAAEIISENNLNCLFTRCGIKSLPRVTGSREFLNDLNGLSPEKLAQKAAQSYHSTKNGKRHWHSQLKSKEPICLIIGARFFLLALTTTSGLAIVYSSIKAKSLDVVLAELAMQIISPSDFLIPNFTAWAQPFSLLSHTFNTEY